MNIYKIIKRLFCWGLGNIIVLTGRYKRKYIKGKYFFGDKSGKFAVGWEWVVRDYYSCKRLDRNTDVPWPISPLINIVNWENIVFHPDDLNNFQGVGNYFQADGKITIGRGTYIAPNVGIITANHDINDPAKRLKPQEIIIGEKCWIGMNAMILPGVKLGPHTVVGAGAVVTKSFEEGYCVLAGIPASVIKKIDSKM